MRLVECKKSKYHGHHPEKEPCRWCAPGGDVDLITYKPHLGVWSGSLSELIAKCQASGGSVSVERSEWLYAALHEVCFSLVEHQGISTLAGVYAQARWEIALRPKAGTK